MTPRGWRRLGLPAAPGAAQAGGRAVKVVYVIDDLGFGGAQRQLLELIKALPRQRYEPHVVSLSTEKRGYAQAIRAAGVPVTLITQSGMWSWGAWAKLLRIMRAERPDIVHTWLFTADLYGRLAAWLGGVPFGARPAGRRGAADPREGARQRIGW